MRELDEEMYYLAGESEHGEDPEIGYTELPGDPDYGGYDDLPGVPDYPGYEEDEDEDEEPSCTEEPPEG